MLGFDPGDGPQPKTLEDKAYYRGYIFGFVVATVAWFLMFGMLALHHFVIT